MIIWSNVGVTLLFEHLPIQESKIEHFEIFSRPQENTLAQGFLIKFYFMLLLLIS